MAGARLGILALWGAFSAGLPAAAGEADMGQAGVEALEARLKEASEALREAPVTSSAAADKDLVPVDKAKAACEAMLPIVRKLTAAYGEDLAQRAPDRAEYIRSRMNDGSARAPAEATVVLYGSAREDDVLERWRGQLRETLRGVIGLLDNEEEACRNWLDATDWRRIQGGRPFFRAEQIRNGLHETAKLAALLTAPRKTVRLTKGEILFRDDFSGDLSQWKTYGGGQAVLGAGRLKFSGEGCTLWCEKECGDALVGFGFQPVSLQGKAAGSLFAFPASPLPGKDFAVSAGPMPEYNYGIATYHCSLCRGDTGMTNLRRTGTGLRMLSTIRPDPCRELNRTYRVEMLKYGPTLQVYVDGRLYHSYFDAGSYGPPLEKGRFGIRHFAGAVFEALYSHFEIAAPAATP